MLNNKEIRLGARTALKRNYWIIIFVCAVLMFLNIIPGSGTGIANLDSATFTGQVSDQANDVLSADYTPGLIRYLTSFFNGDGRHQQIAKEVIKSFEGTGGAIFGLMKFIDRLVFSNDTLASVIIIISIIVYLCFVIFLKNIIYAGYERFNCGAYNGSRKPKFTDVFIIFRTCGYWSALKTMLCWSLLFDLLIAAFLGLFAVAFYLFFVSKMIAFAIICLFFGIVLLAADVVLYIEFIFVPYIVGSNPEIGIRECFTLSRRLTRGNIKSMILLRLSYLPWDILSLITFGLADLFYKVPVINLAFGGVYLKLREQALENKVEYSELISNDVTDPADFKENRLAKLMKDRNPARHYDLVNLILLFFIFAFVGWCWEVLLHIVQDGIFINRGTMHGPWLPIYGFGGVFIIICLRKLSHKPVLLGVTTIVLCGVLEYFGHWYLEITKGMKWWDYSNHFLNLNGRICFEGLLVFMLAGLAAVYILGPALDDLLNRVSKKIRWIVAAVLVAIFSCDLVYSHYVPNVGRGITDYGKKAAK